MEFSNNGLLLESPVEVASAMNITTAAMVKFDSTLDPGPEFHRRIRVLAPELLAATEDEQDSLMLNTAQSELLVDGARIAEVNYAYALGMVTAAYGVLNIPPELVCEDLLAPGDTLLVDYLGELGLGAQLVFETYAMTRTMAHELILKHSLFKSDQALGI